MIGESANSIAAASSAGGWAKSKVLARTLLIHGARAALSRAGGKQNPRGKWLVKLRERRRPNIAAVALANKNARIAWAMLSGDETYDPGLTVGPA